MFATGLALRPPLEYRHRLLAAAVTSSTGVVHGAAGEGLAREVGAKHELDERVLAETGSPAARKPCSRRERVRSPDDFVQREVDYADGEVMHLQHARGKHRYVRSIVLRQLCCRRRLHYGKRTETADLTAGPLLTGGPCKIGYQAGSSCCFRAALIVSTRFPRRGGPVRARGRLRRWGERLEIFGLAADTPSFEDFCRHLNQTAERLDSSSTTPARPAPASALSPHE